LSSRPRPVGEFVKDYKMASNTRGKLKENFEGMHRNFDWIKHHITKSVALIQHHKPNLTDALQGLDEQVDQLDELVQQIYSQL